MESTYDNSREICIPNELRTELYRTAQDRKTRVSLLVAQAIRQLIAPDVVAREQRRQARVPNAKYGRGWPVFKPVNEHKIVGELTMLPPAGDGAEEWDYYLRSLAGRVRQVCAAASETCLDLGELEAGIEALEDAADSLDRAAEAVGTDGPRFWTGEAPPKRIRRKLELWAGAPAGLAALIQHFKAFTASMLRPVDDKALVLAEVSKLTPLQRQLIASVLPPDPLTLRDARTRLGISDRTARGILRRARKLLKIRIVPPQFRQPANAAWKIVAAVTAAQTSYAEIQKLLKAVGLEPLAAPAPVKAATRPRTTATRLPAVKGKSVCTRPPVTRSLSRTSPRSTASLVG